MVTEEQLEKWKVLINACKAYYIDSLPTGLSDSEFDELEKRAMVEDSFSVRDYVFKTFLKGTKTKNSWIEKIKKEKVENTTMLQAMSDFEVQTGKSFYYDLKYDGSSLAIYLDPSTGKPLRIVTVGNLNLDNYGIDQTWKLINFLPKEFPKGIIAIQAEALIDLNRLTDSDPERARQRANGLINSKNCDVEVNNLLTIRAYRYYCDNSVYGDIIKNMDYREVLSSFETVYSYIDGHVLFSPADAWTLEELKTLSGFTESDKSMTSTGSFLHDGWVIYDNHGVCQKALKYSGAGLESEKIKTTVQSIQWNDQVSKGKDSWSANVIIDPVTIKGCVVKKPSAGSVNKLVKSNITEGAVVSIIMANSTIPMVGEVFTPGNGNFMWPTCSCGYTMSSKDIYGSLLKCGNPLCSQRLNRMREYLNSLTDVSKQLDLKEFLVIDRFKWENEKVDIPTLLKFIEDNNIVKYKEYLESFMRTDLQKRNLDLVYQASFKALRELYIKLTDNKGN